MIRFLKSMLRPSASHAAARLSEQARTVARDRRIAKMNQMRAELGLPLWAPGRRA